MAAPQPRPQRRPFHLKLAREVPLIEDAFRAIGKAWRQTMRRNWIFCIYLLSLDISLYFILRSICWLCPGLVEQASSYACRKLDELKLKLKYPSIRLPRREVTRRFQRRLLPTGLCGRILPLIPRICFRAATIPASLALRACFHLVDLVAYVMALPAKLAVILGIVVVIKPVVSLLMCWLYLHIFVSLSRLCSKCILNKLNEVRNAGIQAVIRPRGQAVIPRVRPRIDLHVQRQWRSSRRA